MLGIRMKSTRNFLARYEGSVIEGVDDDVLSNVPKYYLRARCLDSGDEVDDGKPVQALGM